MKTLTKDTRVLTYKLIKKKNKNTYFRFKHNYIEVSQSKYHSDSDILKLLNQNFDYYYDKLETLMKSTPNSNEIILEEQSYELVIAKGNKFNYEINNNQIIVTTKLTDISKIKYEIYKAHLKQMVSKINYDYSIILEGHGIKEVEIKYGYFKTKLGSYHRLSNIIKLNIVLAKTDIKYLYYVIMHEYAHTKVFNHSKDFYNLLIKLMPDYKYYDKNLKKLSILL